MNQKSRRKCIGVAASFCAVLGGLLPRLSWPQSPEISYADARLKHRFRDIKGGELFIDAITDDLGGPALYLNGDPELVFATGKFSPTKNLKTGYGGSTPGDRITVPITLRYVRHYPSIQRIDTHRHPLYKGPIVTDVTVKVAERIPDAILDRIRKYKGYLKLKLRLTPDTVLVAWEAGFGRNYPFKRDEWGNAYVTDEDTMPGGDFRERRVDARAIGGKMVDFDYKGWYIDPKTGKKIETDF